VTIGCAGGRSRKRSDSRLNGGRGGEVAFISPLGSSKGEWVRGLAAGWRFRTGIPAARANASRVLIHFSFGLLPKSRRLV